MLQEELQCEKRMCPNVVYIFPCRLTDRLHVNTHSEVFSKLVCPAGHIDLVHCLERSCRNLGAAQESGQLLLILHTEKPMRVNSLPEVVEILPTFTSVASDACWLCHTRSAIKKTVSPNLLLTSWWNTTASWESGVPTRTVVWWRLWTVEIPVRDQMQKETSTDLKIFSRHNVIDLLSEALLIQRSLNHFFPVKYHWMTCGGH